MLKKQTPRYKRFTRSRFGNFLYMLFLIAIGIFTILPIVYSIVTSFKPLDELLAFPPKFFVVRPTLKNYAALPELISNLAVPLSRYVFNTIFVTVSITLIQVLLACMGAYVLCQVKNKATKVFFMVVQFALLYNGATLAVPQYLILANLHAIDNYWSYILPALASTMGIFLVKQSMEANIPEALIEAARIDGASAWRIFWRIVMPLAKPAWLTAGLFSFQAAWSATADGLLFTESYKTLPSVINSVVSGGIARSGSAMAVTVIMMIPPVIVYLVTQSNVLETMSTSGIKD